MNFQGFNLDLKIFKDISVWKFSIPLLYMFWLKFAVEFYQYGYRILNVYISLQLKSCNLVIDNVFGGVFFVGFFVVVFFFTKNIRLGQIVEGQNDFSKRIYRFYENALIKTIFIIVLFFIYIPLFL